MLSPQQIVMIVLGIIACIGGYSLFRSMAPLWGFILGGWIGYTLLPLFTSSSAANNVVLQIVAFIGGGLIGALIAVPLYFVIIFFSGAALGALFGIMLGAVIDVGGISTVRQLTTLSNMVFPPLPQTPIQLLLMVVFGVILGGASINFQKFMVIASSSFLGSAALVSGVGGSVFRLVTTGGGQAALMMAAWMVIGMLSMLLQFRMMDET
jgi:hypothetical protein